MSNYFIYYTESSIICLIIFGIMLIHDLGNVDRRERQIRYDQALVAFMLYFISDAFWAAIIAGVLPQTRFNIATANFFNFIFMAGITYTWLRYVLSISPDKDRFGTRGSRAYIPAIPLILSVIALIFMYIAFPKLVIPDGLMPTSFYSMFQIAIPIIYIVSVMIFALRRAAEEKSPIDKRQHLYLGLFPLMVIIGGLVQIILLPDIPIFCFSCAILMLIFYIRSMEDQISLDPLTGLNNRGQLHRYISQESNLYREGLRTFVVMIDVNDFKKVNDGYGHAEGDRALELIADSLRKAVPSAGGPVFMARYGGDEFVLILHNSDESVCERMTGEIRRQIALHSKEAGVPYSLSIACGWDELLPEDDSFHDCLERADRKCYADKAGQKGLK